ncbi:ComEC/Rec2 family competence protein [Clostridium manihotivorum]|uniref:ComEC/Rec2-related protein domain-containing protein n=1 Tax=Clostridium manihotivorum TaxID=2320868 RepID=A0A3R5QT38_9CLOT|nr:ComEC/Rec2 family competence protein [Clostridium manihotivorum]QAA31712.1 hypothetical protein C1I91_08660 [Clostridium manihotivorum]
MINKIINNEEVKRPAVNILVSCIAGILTFNIVKVSFLGAVLIAASFFLIHFFIYSKNFIAVIIIFFIASYVNSMVYYNFYTNTEDVFKVEVLNSKSNICEIGRQSFKLQGKLPELKDGGKYVLYGRLERKADYEKGIVGAIEVSKYSCLKNGFSGSSNEKQDEFYNRMKKYIGEDGTALVCSAAFGYTKYLKDDENTLMSKFGIIHVVSVSGFHIAVVYSIIERLLGFKVALLISFIYTIFSGGKSSTWRAFIMILILKLSKKLYRNYDSISSLCFSAILLLCYKPYYLYDIGFELSYLSTLGILLFYNKLRRKFYKLPELISDTFCISISAQVFSFPVATLSLNNFSPNFMWGNLFLLPMFTAIVILGNIAFLLMFNDKVFTISAYIIKLFIVALQGGISFIDQFSLKVTTINFNIVYGYCLILICIYMYSKGYRKAKAVAWAVFVCVIVSLYSFQTKVTLINENKTKALLIEQGFKRILIIPNLTGYSYNVINKKYYPTESLKWVNKQPYVEGNIAVMPKDKEKEIVIVNKGKSYIVALNNQCYICKQYYDIIKTSGKGELISSKKASDVLSDTIIESEGDNGD